MHRGHRIWNAIFGNDLKTIVSVLRPVCTATPATGHRIRMSDISPINPRSRKKPPLELYFANGGWPSRLDLMVFTDVRFGSKADMCSTLGDVRFTPESGIKSRHSAKAVSAYPWLTAPPFMH